MAVLITGGAGFIGSSLIPSLLAAGSDRIICIDNLHPQVHGAAGAVPGHLRDPRVTFVRGDVADPGTWDAALEMGAPDAVVHLAAETGTGQSLREAARHTHVNVHGTAVMLDALSAREIVPRSILLTSSRAVYGEGRWRTDAGEYFYPPPRSLSQLQAAQWDPAPPSGATASFTPHDAATVQASPTNVYAATKLAQEHILVSWCSAFDVPLSILRLQNVYGAGQAVGNAYTGVLTFFARQVATAQPLEVFEDGNIIRDFVHVSDAVAALRLALAKPPVSEDGGPRHRVLDIGSGQPVSLLECASVLANLDHRVPVTVTGAFRLGDVRAAYADISAAREMLGFVPQVAFSDGARSLLTWVRDQIRP